MISAAASFSYKRVRAVDNDVWRLRVAGFRRERADQIYQAVTEMSGTARLDQSDEEHVCSGTMSYFPDWQRGPVAVLDAGRVAFARRVRDRAERQMAKETARDCKPC